MITRLICICSLFLIAGTASGEGTYQHTRDGKTIVWNDNPKPGDTATWLGDQDGEGYATKIGTLTWYTARGNVYARFRGNMIRGKFNGMVNGYSRRKTGHAVFVAGQRTTRWAAGASSASELVQPPPVKPPEKKMKVESAEHRVSPAASVRSSANPINREHNESAPETVLKRPGPENIREETRPSITIAEPTPLPENPTPNAGTDSERVSPAGTNELTPEQVPSAPPVAAVEKPADDSKRAEPSAPAEGPRVDLAESASATVTHSSAGDQAIEEKAWEAIPAPEEATTNGPATSDKATEAEEPVPSAQSPRPKSQTSASPHAHRNLTTEEVIMLANAELRKQGYNRMDYIRQEPQFEADKGSWLVSYDPMTFDGIETAGQHFSVIIEDRRKGAVFLLRK